MFPITAANIGTWLAIASAVLGPISTWFYTQYALKRHTRELGLDESMTLRERVLSIENDAQDLTKRVDANHEDAKTRHQEILGRMDNLGSKLEDISKAVWQWSGGSREK